MQIERKRGDTNPDIITVSFAKTRGAVNVTGCTFKLTVSTVPDPVDTTTQAYQLDGVITDPVKGVVEFAPTVDQANLVGYFYYDIQMVDSFGKIITLVSGTYLYKQDITKA